MKKSKFKNLEKVVFAPKWVTKQYPLDRRHPLRMNETVLYLGEIPNVPGHCAVAKHSGKVVWMVHPEDFRKCKESEL